MAGSAGVLEGVAGHTRALVEHRGDGMRAILEERQREMTPRQLIVASAAIVLLVARCAGSPVERGIFSVQIVLPPRRMGFRTHYLVARQALIRPPCSGNLVLVAREALRVPGRGLGRMVGPKDSSVEFRLYVACVVRGQSTFAFIRMARTAIGHLRALRHSPRLIVACDTVHHLGQRAVRRVTSGAADPPRLLLGEMCGMRENNSFVFGRRGRGTDALSFEARFRVTGIALHLRRHDRQHAALVEPVAKSAIGAKSGPRIDPRLRVNMLRVRERRLRSGVGCVPQNQY